MQTHPLIIKIFGMSQYICTNSTVCWIYG